MGKKKYCNGCGAEMVPADHMDDVELVCPNFGTELTGWHDMISPKLQSALDGVLAVTKGEEMIGECAHCGQTLKVVKAPEDSDLEYQPRYHDWPPMCRQICKGRMMEPLNVREGEEEDERG